MKRIRFLANGDDCRPIVYPVKHPWWCTGYTDRGNKTWAIIVSYADDEGYITNNWPEACEIDVMEETDHYTFTDRFPKPEAR